MTTVRATSFRSLVAPEGIDAVRWFNSLKTSYANLYVPSLLKEEDWPCIALYLKGYNVFRGRVPSPFGFKDWRMWARAFVNQVGV